MLTTSEKLSSEMEGFFCCTVFVRQHHFKSKKFPSSINPNTGAWVLENCFSISRDYNMIIPLKMEETPNRVVTTMLEETRFIKDGTNNRSIYYERLYLKEAKYFDIVSLIN
ncbi:MAG: hypothetical protein ACO3QK_06155 [Flavobacteriaceae bacterium]